MLNRDPDVTLTESFICVCGAAYLVVSFCFFVIFAWNGWFGDPKFERMKFCIEKKISAEDCAKYYGEKK